MRASKNFVRVVPDAIKPPGTPKTQWSENTRHTCCRESDHPPILRVFSKLGALGDFAVYSLASDDKIGPANRGGFRRRSMRMPMKMKRT
jgi:hypothetical protein